MFDFKKWRPWLEAQEKLLKGEGLETRFACGPEDTPKQKMILEITDGKKYGGFETWITGETDYTVQLFSEAPNPRQSRWGIIVSDQSFEALFGEFLDHYQKLQTP